MKIVEIERCNPFCPYNTMLSLRKVYCQHAKVGKYRAKRIAYSKITDKYPFPEWCPLDDVRDSFCYLYKKKCMGIFCSTTPNPEKCEYLT